MMSFEYKGKKQLNVDGAAALQAFSTKTHHQLSNHLFYLKLNIFFKKIIF